MPATIYQEPDIQVLDWKFCPWPEREDAIEMQFRLVYQGKLPAASNHDTRSKEKHLMRKVFHKQLAELWDKHPMLKRWRTDRAYASIKRGKDSELVTVEDLIADNYERCGYRFCPLINNDDSLACSLDILFLRRDGPGNIIDSGGDIDNRIKVLFDALRMPQNCSEVQHFPKPEADENPFYCLLEDDKLIAEVKLTTDRLLEPMHSGEHINDVHLVIHVRTLVMGEGHLTAFLT